jgi:hypothetical protein
MRLDLHRIGTSILVSSLFATLSDCTCTLLACASELAIEITGSRATVNGTYRVEITTDSAGTECVFTQPGEMQPSCSQPGVAEFRFTLSETGVRTLESIVLPGAPASATIRVLRDGAEIAHQTYLPSYDVSQPNGPYCGPVCERATDTLSLR